MLSETCGKKHCCQFMQIAPTYIDFSDPLIDFFLSPKPSKSSDVYFCVPETYGKVAE